MRERFNTNCYIEVKEHGKWTPITILGTLGRIRTYDEETLREKPHRGLPPNAPESIKQALSKKSYYVGWATLNDLVLQYKRVAYIHRDNADRIKEMAHFIGKIKGVVEFFYPKVTSPLDVRIIFEVV